MKIAVYTIALNEEKHVERWINSCKNADYIIVGDTGSTDKTKELLNSHNIRVIDVSIKPWRFDSARNTVLSLIPADADICISLDMDEFLCPNWRDILETSWTDKTTRLSYKYAFDFNRPESAFWVDKIHSRFGYIWKRPVHETVFPMDGFEEFISSTDQVLINQIQEIKDTRNNYLPLMKLAVDEDKNDPQILFWYARELNNYGHKKEAIDAFNNFLKMDSWFGERSEAMLYLSKLTDDMSWLYKALSETQTRLEIWQELATKYYNSKDWVNCYWACKNGIDKSIKTQTYLDHGNLLLIYDMGSLAAHYLGLKGESINFCEKAIELSPKDTRLKNNLFHFKKLEDNCS